MLKILIVDDHPVVREGLKHILSREPDMGIFGEAGNSGATLDLVREQDWDIAVLDINMPGRNGLDVLKELKHLRPKLPVLILSMYPEDQYAVRSLKAGASGYMVKEGAPKSLVRAIRKILKGEKYISPVLAEKLVSYLDAETDKPPHETLSNREHQTMIMMASGKTIKEISQELCLSAKTISTYRDRIFKKMKIKRSVELVHYAIKHGLIDQ